MCFAPDLTTASAHETRSIEFVLQACHFVCAEAVIVKSPTVRCVEPVLRLGATALAPEA